MMHAAARDGRLLDAFVVRKGEKAHGLQRRIEGPDVAGRRVLASGGHLDDGGLGADGRGRPTGGGAEVAGSPCWSTAAPRNALPVSACRTGQLMSRQIWASDRSARSPQP